MKNSVKDKAILSTLDPKWDTGYINLVFYPVSKKWSVCWVPQYFGAKRRKDAVRMRGEFLRHLQRGTGGAKRSLWRKHHLRTVRVV